MTTPEDANTVAGGSPVERGVSRLLEEAMKATTLEILMARRDALRALTYKTDAITAELERLY